MCHKRTSSVACLSFAIALCCAPARAQILADWRRVGSTTLDLNLASLATGPVERVWFTDGGARVSVRTSLKRIYSTTDFEHWELSSDDAVPDPLPGLTRHLPEKSAKTRMAAALPSRIYAVGAFAYRSDDGGFSWTNLTAFKHRSIIGEGLTDLAVSPKDADEIVVSGAQGVWRSLDGGQSWTGINQGLPNFRVRRILSLPDGIGALRILADNEGTELEWPSGEKTGWKPVQDAVASEEVARKAALSKTFGATVTALAAAGEFAYAGTADGKLRTSTDRGATWQQFDLPGGGAVESIFVDPKDPQFALAAVSGNSRIRVERTLNAGRLWDDLSDNLPAGAAYGITADRQSGAMYVATARGVFMTYADTRSLAPSTSWTLVKAGPDNAAAMDVTLDSGGHQLYVAFEGAGVFAAMAPHRLRDPRVVSSGDMTARAAAPGSLLSVVGRSVESAQAGDKRAPVLAASSEQSQIQVPFEVSGSTLNLSMDSSAGKISVGLPLKSASPSIFVDRDGGPIVTNADTGLLLDAGTPAKSGSRLQIFATGLGKVKPDWPTGIAAPFDNSPRVAAATSVYLDRQPIEVSRAILAPGYIGFYLIEIQLPRIVNSGPAELYVEVEGQQSNRVRVYLEP